MSNWTPEPWGYYGSPNAKEWAASAGFLEAAAGINIGSPTHTEPIARFSGYLMDAEANAKRAVDCVNGCATIANPAAVAALMDAASRAKPFLYGISINATIAKDTQAVARLFMDKLQAALDAAGRSG